MKANERFGYKHRGFYLKALLVLMIGVAFFPLGGIAQTRALEHIQGLKDRHSQLGNITSVAFSPDGRKLGRREFG